MKTKCSICNTKKSTENKAKESEKEFIKTQEYIV